MPKSERDEIIGQLTDATVHLVDVNLDLAKRVAGSVAARGVRGLRDAGSPQEPGPAEDIWMTWAQSAGDVVQIAYLTSRLVDSLWPGSRSSSSQSDRPDQSGQSDQSSQSDRPDRHD
ncbi:MAG TPA: hypothetical protein VEJ87_05045 [Acidimicrobiales bacterium]|nr:hypothetical protein [Acidimicrobiales bacterium]